MAFSKLADIKKKAAEKTGFSGDRESPFLTLKDGQKVKIRFLQEFDDDSSLYDERRGSIVVIEEHAAPQDFRKSAVCTAESEGRCWACEQISTPEIGKKWKPKMKFYANVIVRDPDGEDKVKVIKRGFSDRDVGSKLIGIAEEFEFIGGMDMSYSRKGSEMDTSYDIIPLAPKKLTSADEALEVIDINKFLKQISYDDQAAFYTGSEDSANADSWG